MRTKNVEVVKDRWTDGLALEISHNGLANNFYQ